MRIYMLLVMFFFLLLGCQSKAPVEVPLREQTDGQESSISMNTDTSSPNTDSGEQLFRELAMRLLVPPYFGGPEGGEIQLLTGELPDNLPLEVPLPDGARVIGSFIRGDKSTEIVLDAPQSPEDVLNFYEERLIAAGWEKPESPGLSGGFVSSDIANGTSLCQSKKGPRFSVSTRENETRLTDVRLSLSNGRHSGCNMSTDYMGPEGPIPDLVPPTGARQWGGSGGGGDDSFYTSAELETELASAEVAKHYTEQLNAAGWTLLSSADADEVAWSSWSFEDEHGDVWSGFFFAHEMPDIELHLVYISTYLVE